MAAKAKIRLRKFGSVDCPPCRTMVRNRVLERLAEKNPDVELAVNDNLSMGDPTTALEEAAEKEAEKYKIRSMPTILIEDPADDEILVRHGGGVNLTEAEALLERARRKLKKKHGE